MKERQSCGKQFVSISTDGIQQTFLQQAQALQSLAESFDERSYQSALALLQQAQGHVVVSGMGKSGHVGKKMAATLASTGTPSFFLHPSEAFHGDLGMITANDVVLLISNSGETAEIVQLLPSLQQFGNRVIALTSQPESTLAKAADVALSIALEREACPYNLAPTTSTTVTMAMGDALALALMQNKGFGADDFARFHPGGRLGRRLLSRVKDIMTAKPIPNVLLETPLTETLVIMNEGRLGMVLVMSDAGVLQGIITDGDVRRSLVNLTAFDNVCANQMMTPSPQCISPFSSLLDAETRFQSHRIGCLVVVDPDNNEVVGVVQIHQV
jgi:arabinose-5-phosphate isomerase